MKNLYFIVFVICFVLTSCGKSKPNTNTDPMIDTLDYYVEQYNASNKYNILDSVKITKVLNYKTINDGYYRKPAFCERNSDGTIKKVISLDDILDRPNEYGHLCFQAYSLLKRTNPDYIGAIRFDTPQGEYFLLQPYDGMPRKTVQKVVDYFDNEYITPQKREDYLDLLKTLLDLKKNE